MAAVTMRARPFADWLPMSGAMAQAPPPPALAPGVAVGLSALPAGIVSPGEAAQQGGSCCGSAATQVQAVALERLVQRAIAPVKLMSVLVADVSSSMADELLILRSAEKLRANICKLGITKPTTGCYDAHHIVGVAASRFTVVGQSHLIFAKFGMDIDYGHNGVYLDCAVHKALHNAQYAVQNVYHTAVYNYIRLSTSYADMASRLQPSRQRSQPVALIPDLDRLVFEVWPGGEGLLGLTTANKESNAIFLSEPLIGQGRMAGMWRPFHFRTWGGRKKNRMPDIGFVGAPLIRAELFDALFKGSEELLEALPVAVEGKPWSYLHCFEPLAELDEARSHYTPPPMVHPWQRYALIHRAVLRDDPRLYGAIFTIKENNAGLYCGAGFRDRVEQLGLEGLSFKEVGFFHREGDPEPPPPEPWLPQKPALDLPPPVWQASDLSADLQSILSNADNEARNRLGLGADAPDDTVLKALTQEIVDLRPRYARLQPDERRRMLLGLSAAYGLLYVGRLGWTWCELSSPDGEHLLAVSTSNRSHFMAVSTLIHELISHKQRDITLALSFNMARHGSLPPSAPGALVQLAN